MYKLNDAEMFYDMADGQAVVINITTGIYYGSNLLGSEIIDRLVKGNDPEKIYEAVSKLDGCPENFKDTMKTFIQKLQSNNILIQGETTPGGDEPINAESVTDGFDLPFIEFSEVQDLLLADPVHEVEEDAGWPTLKED